MEQMFRRTAQQALEQLDTTTQGLSDAEIAKRRETYGENALAEEKKKSPLVVFLEQFKDLLVIILIAAAVISALSGNGESTIVIVAVITLNAILGTVQHFKAEKSLESLKALSSPSDAKWREGGSSFQRNRSGRHPAAGSRGPCGSRWAYHRKLLVTGQ